MAKSLYKKEEAANRILRSLEGKSHLSDAPETLAGDILPMEEALSDIASLMDGSLAGESGILPFGIKATPGAYSDSKSFYVIPDHANAADTNSGENPAYPLVTVARAFALARAYRDDHIFVTTSNSWQYGSNTEDGVVESLVIPATKPGVHLIGVSPSSLGVYWQPTGSAGWCIWNNALDTEIAGFCFWSNTATCNGIYNNWAGPTAFGENFDIHHNTFTDDVDTGIELNYTWYGKIHDNYFQDCNIYGVAATFSGSGVQFLDIYDNRFHNIGTTALLLGECEDSHILNNTFFNEFMITGSQSAFCIHTASGSANNMIAGNQFSTLKAYYNTVNRFSATDAFVASAADFIYVP
jgi:hypothetical protein